MSRPARILAAAALVAVAAGALAVAWLRVLAPAVEDQLAVTFGRGEYVLTATDGSTFTQDSLKGTPSVVFFGFTHCPEVCPTTLGDIAAWQEALGTEADRLRVFFITVDPERDTLERLADYVSWVPGASGVSGPREEIDKAILAFRIYAKKVPLDGGDYTMDHSASVLLFDGRGDFFEPIGYGEDHDRAVAKLRRLLQG